MEGIRLDEGAVLKTVARLKTVQSSSLWSSASNHDYIGDRWIDIEGDNPTILDHFFIWEGTVGTVAR